MFLLVGLPASGIKGIDMDDESQPKILIVDDEADICEMMMFTFESKGFEAFSANDAEEAFANTIKRRLFGHTTPLPSLNKITKGHQVVW